MNDMISANLSKSSLAAYRRSWGVYCNFVAEFLIPQVSIISPSSLMLFMAYLRFQNLKSSTISTYVSEIRYCAKLLGYPDPGSDFLVTLSLSGLAKLSGPLDARLPITIPILGKLVASVNSVFFSHYDQYMVKAMLTLAFFAFLRVGEFTVVSKNQIPTITASAVHMNQSDLHHGMSLTFSAYKHSKGTRPFILQIPRQKFDSLCPVLHLANYLAIRVDTPGALFVHADGNPVRKETFRTYLNTLLKCNSLDPSLYKGHSFRIGAASWAAENGYSDSQIRLLGRWKSDAFKKYIRNVSFSL